MAALGFEFLRHFMQHGREVFNGDFAFAAVENLHEARHVRAFVVVRQADVHVEHGDGVLHAARAVEHLDRVADGLDADPIDGDMARIGQILHVDHGFVSGVHGLSCGFRHEWTF